MIRTDTVGLTSISASTRSFQAALGPPLILQDRKRYFHGHNELSVRELTFQDKLEKLGRPDLAANVWASRKYQRLDNMVGQQLRYAIHVWAMRQAFLGEDRGGPRPDNDTEIERARVNREWIAEMKDKYAGHPGLARVIAMCAENGEPEDLGETERV